MAEYSICLYCGMDIARDSYGAWISNPDQSPGWYSNTARDRGDEPWFGACPGSRHMLKLYPTFGAYMRDSQRRKTSDRLHETHAPAPKLILAAQRAINDV